MDLGVPLTLIGESVFARCLSAQKEERVEASKVLGSPIKQYDGDKKQFVKYIKDALFASKIVSYAQGYVLMREAAKENNWDLNYGGIALMWRGGCIIRSVFLGKIKEAFDNNPELPNLLLDPYFKEKINDAIEGWRQVVAHSVLSGIPVPTFSSALSYLMVTEQKNYQQIYYRHREIILVRILTKELISQEVNIFIQTGLEEVEILLLRLMMYKIICK